jgi:hypothetical protein
LIAQAYENMEKIKVIDAKKKSNDFLIVGLEKDQGF